VTVPTCYLCGKDTVAEHFVCMGDFINLNDNEYLYHSEETWPLCLKHSDMVYKKLTSKEFWEFDVE